MGGVTFALERSNLGTDPSAMSASDRPRLLRHVELAPPEPKTEIVNFSVGPNSGDTHLRPAAFEGFGSSAYRTIYCRSADLVEVKCFRYGYHAWSISMQCTIQGRTWSGSFVFSDPLCEPDNGTPRFTKRETRMMQGHVPASGRSRTAR